jgi:hypothetical protein
MVGSKEAIIPAITDFLVKPTWKFSSSFTFIRKMSTNFSVKKKFRSGGQRDRARCRKRSFTH